MLMNIYVDEHTSVSVAAHAALRLCLSMGSTWGLKSTIVGTVYADFCTDLQISLWICKSLVNILR